MALGGGGLGGACLGGHRGTGHPDYAPVFTCWEALVTKLNIKVLRRLLSLQILTKMVNHKVKMVLIRTQTQEQFYKKFKLSGKEIF